MKDERQEMVAVIEQLIADNGLEATISAIRSGETHGLLDNIDCITNYPCGVQIDINSPYGPILVGHRVDPITGRVRAGLGYQAGEGRRIQPVWASLATGSRNNARVDRF